MRKRLLNALVIFFFVFFLNVDEASAYSSENYKYRNLCGNFEVAELKSDGSINAYSCHSTYESARVSMKSNGGDDLVVFAKVGGLTKIIDANMALVDLSVNPETLTYFYKTSALKTEYTYMDTGSLYGGVDGAFIDGTYSIEKNVWVAKVKIGNFTGWVRQATYEIVPLSWVRSTSTYTVTNSSIKHNYVNKIQEVYTGSRGSTIGPKPDMLNTGTYYSYDGHYFYRNLRTMLVDYKNGNYNNSVNKDEPYYNYYMYLSNHTRTTYSSFNIDEYIRGTMGITQEAYGNDTNSSRTSSRLYGKGTFFYYAQEKYGVNAILSLSLSRNETGNGTSNLAINKNNGFGLNAVDSSPTESAKWYASFSSSILGYASKWITYGYAHPRNWRYFGPQFGDKFIGMNVKYASDTYWSEKMAANYYAFDSAKGLQDYNYYQLGVVTRSVNAMSDASNNSKFIYSYPEAEDAVVIVGEKQGESIEGYTTWYEVVSDLNIDNNYNEITSGDYNWNRTVYIPAAYVKKINKGKNGYISPNSVTEYQNKNYEYDLYVEDTVLVPKVAITTKDTNYYYDSALQTRKNQTLLKDKYVMVYTACFDEYGNPVSYLVTSDYKYDQKEWVPADTIKFVNGRYGKVTVSVSGNQYTWVNSTPHDVYSTLISGQYTNSYVPILEEVTSDGMLWYKVPVNLSSNYNSYGYTLASAPGVSVTPYTSKVENHTPVINAENITITQGDKWNALDYVNATDIEDGNITSNIKVVKNIENTDTVGTFDITYEVSDSKGEKATKTVKVTIIKNEEPVINASDKTITEKQDWDNLKGVNATDKEDGDLTKKIKVVEDTTNKDVVGQYYVTYEVVDSYNQKVTKKIKVTVEEDQKPVINATDIKIAQGTEFNPLDGVEAIDKEDGDITEKIEVLENTVNTKELGEYKVIYKVVDSFKNTQELEIKVEVVEKVLEEMDGEFYLEDISWNKEKEVYSIKGYLIILGINNDVSDVEYELILKNKSDDKEYIFELDNWTKDVPFSLGSENNNSYEKSWFKGNVDLKDVPQGDYDLYLRSEKGLYYAEEIVDNIFNKSIDRRAETKDKGYSLKVLLSLKSKKIELSIRDELITTSSANTFRNMVNDYDEMNFVDGKLQVKGTSYNYDGTYKDQDKITRKLILENTKTYKKYTYDLGSTKNGSYKVTSTDNKDKTYAWYDKTIDISDLEKGTYTMMVYTKTVDSEDYGEINDIFGMINKEEVVINDKNYKLNLNKERQNRIELVVE